MLLQNSLLAKTHLAQLFALMLAEKERKQKSKENQLFTHFDR